MAVLVTRWFHASTGLFSSQSCHSLIQYDILIDTVVRRVIHDCVLFCCHTGGSQATMGSVGRRTFSAHCSALIMLLRQI